MSDTGAPGGPPNEPTELPAGPHRVIGTPPPAQARTMLGDRPGEGGSPPAQRELPSDLPDPARAKRAERLVVALFILSMLASIGFIAAYVGLEVGSVDAVFRSNLALGLSMSVAFLALAVGAVIWVRHLMPNVELTEQRHPLRSDPEVREAFKETFEEGADASQFTKRPLVRRMDRKRCIRTVVGQARRLDDSADYNRTEVRRGARLSRRTHRNPADRLQR